MVTWEEAARVIKNMQNEMNAAFNLIGEGLCVAEIFLFMYFFQV
jgi:hypothetical protein